MAPGAGYVIEGLSKTHYLGDFDCGNEALDTWLKRFAWTNVQNDAARVYVLHRRDNVVLGHHALTAGSISREEAHPIGVAVMGRLALHSSEQGNGLGVTLLQDALMRIEHAAETIAIRAVLVQAINETARNFYLRFGVSVSPVDDLRMMLLMKDLRAFLRTRPD